MKQFQIKVRCGGHTYTESVYTIDTEHAWGYQGELEARYERDYGYSARITQVREVK
jgi:hypothetical protein